MKSPKLSFVLLGFLILAMLGITLLASTLATQATFTQASQEQRHKFGSFMALMSYNLEHNYSRNDEQGIRHNIALSAVQHNIKSVILFNERGVIELSSGSDEPSTAISPQLLAEANKLKMANTRFTPDRQGITALYPIHKNPQERMWLYAKYDLEELTSSIHLQVVQITIICFLATVLLAAVGYRLNRNLLTTPLSQLTTFVTTLSKGDTESHVPKQYWQEFQQLELALENSRKKLQDHTSELKLLAHTFNSEEAIVITDSHYKILRCNPAFEAITGFIEFQVIGQHLKCIISPQQDNIVLEDLWHQVNLNGAWRGELMNRNASHIDYPTSLTISSIRQDQGLVTHYTCMFLDITRQRETEQLVEHQAMYDDLTALPNRRNIMEKLCIALQAANENGHFGALIFIDLDYFKNINDSLGHPIGDKYLSEVAARFSLISNPENTLVSRLGGDEFLVLVKSLGDHLEAAQQLAQAIAKSFSLALNDPITIDHFKLMAGASIGVTVYPQPDQNESASDVLRNADIAMYKAKNQGRGQICFFEKDQIKTSQKRLELQVLLNEAIPQNEFSLRFQPILDTNNQLISAECLIRWNSGTLGFIPPDEFIPLAEDTGMIKTIGDWITNEAFAHLSQWHHQGLLSEKFYLSINVSTRQFDDPAFAQDIEKLANKYQIPPHRITLEITEGLLVKNFSQTKEKLQKIKAMGMKISLDDFGTGYSSLSYIREFPIDILKIDKSFIQNIHEDETTPKLVSAILSLAYHLGVKVVAEGVETADQKTFLDNHQCDLYQGYHLSRPLALPEFLSYMDTAN